MNKIQLNDKDFLFTEDHLPMLIHGEDKAGASLFTITVGANFTSQDKNLLILCGYPMAREEFYKQIEKLPQNNHQVLFFIKDELPQFIETVTSLSDIANRVIIIKNIELFSEETFDLISSYKNIIISGDINKCDFKEKITNIDYCSKVLFSPFEEVTLSGFEKYNGFLSTKSETGVISTKII
jgi:hypothetical protein